MSDIIPLHTARTVSRLRLKDKGMEPRKPRKANQDARVPAYLTTVHMFGQALYKRHKPEIGSGVLLRPEPTCSQVGQGLMSCRSEE